MRMVVVVVAVFMAVVMMRVSAEQVRMSVAFAAPLLNNIVEAECDQRPASNPRKPATDLVSH